MIRIILTPFLLVTVFTLTTEVAFMQQWFDPRTLRCIVLIEKQVQNNYPALGTGFLVTSDREDGTRTPILVTAKHVLQRDKIFISIPADAEIVAYASKYKKTRFKLGDIWWDLSGERLRCEFKPANNGRYRYATHSDTTLDIAAFPLDVRDTCELDGKILKISKVGVLLSSFFKSKKNVQLGDDIYFVGFPFGYGSSDPLSPVLRSGTVAWIKPNGQEFWLDALSYGGNSGSPVFTKSTMTPKLGVFENTPVYLIGMIVGHLAEYYPLQRLNISETLLVAETDTVEIENRGLARAVWVDEILEVVKKASLIKLDGK